ncbi:MAG: hypothetical protein ABIB97_03310 [Patescibacteria group bacterium]
MRKFGYYPLPDPKAKQLSFVRRLGANYYPRWHAYLNKEMTGIKLHLDMKKPSYAGHHAHSGEYDSDLVKEEGERIRQLMRNI